MPASFEERLLERLDALPRERDPDRSVAARVCFAAALLLVATVALRAPRANFATRESSSSSSTASATHRRRRWNPS
jgi:hypothetical protein